MAIGKLVGTLGIGLVAGFVGTTVMTVGQLVEMRLSGRKESKAPAEAATKLLHLSPEDEQAEAQLNTLIHWAYGTGWGLFRPAVAGLGLSGWPATGAHFAAIQGTAWVMLPSLKLAPPPTEWGAKAIATEMFHHAVYAVVTGLTYDALSRWLFTEALPAAAAEESRGRFPVGAIAAGLAAVALRRRPQPAAKLRVTLWQRVPEPIRERIGDWERKLEGV
jgi:hypothetical protein